MKKYIAPSVEVLNINSEAMLALSVNDGYGDGVQLSNRAEDLDMDWED